MTKKEYKTVCNKCYIKTWYETEQQCHVTNLEGERCTGTLKVIDYTNVNTHLVIGERYTFCDKSGTVKRFTLGRTNGWKPCLLLLANSRSKSSSITINAPEIKYLNGVYQVDTYFI